MQQTAQLTDYSIGTYQDSNGFKVRLRDGSFVGWIYRMDHTVDSEKLWGAISTARDDMMDRGLYREGFANRRAAANWLVDRWLTEASSRR